MIFSNVRKELPVAQRLRGQNNFNASPNKYRNKSNNARNIDRKSIAIWKFVHKCTKLGCTRHSLSKFNSALVGTNSLAADVECIESVGAVGAMFKKIFLSFSAFVSFLQYFIVLKKSNYQEAKE